MTDIKDVMAALTATSPLDNAMAGLSALNDQGSFAANKMALRQNRYQEALAGYQLEQGERRAQFEQEQAIAKMALDKSKELREVITMFPEEIRSKVAYDVVMASEADGNDDPMRLADYAMAAGAKYGINSPNKTRELKIGDRVVTQEWDGAQWTDIAEGARFAPSAVTNVNVTTKEESEEAKQVGEYFGKKFGSIQDAADTAVESNLTLDMIEPLIDRVRTGGGTESFLAAKQAAKRLGINLEEWGITDDVAEAEALESFSNKLALSLRSSGNMPGSMSDSDREFLKNTVPNLLKTPDGNRLLVKLMRKMNQRTIEVAQLASEYREENGRLDNGFRKFAEDYARNNPFFTEQERAELMEFKGGKQETAQPANDPLGILQ